MISTSGTLTVCFRVISTNSCRADEPLAVGSLAAACPYVFGSLVPINAGPRPLLGHWLNGENS
jgi:hypothetical protein